MCKNTVYSRLAAHHLITRRCERSEAIQRWHLWHWVAASATPPRNDEIYHYKITALYTAIGTLLIAGLLYAPTAHALPGNVRALVDKACRQEDPFVQFSVVSTVKRQYPVRDAQIGEYWKSGCQDVPEIANAPVAREPLSEPEPPSAWSGEVEASADIRTGNTEKTDMLLRTKLRHEGQQWRNSLALLARNDEEDGTATAEEYRAKGRSDYKLDARNFVFGELEYVDDRFSGYDYRLSEVLGYGRVFVDSERWHWEGRAGVGARQEKLSDGEDNNDLLGKLATDVNWQIAEGLSLSEALDVSATGEAAIIESETALKSKIIDHLALKAAFYVEHITDVPADTKDTDTRTTLGVVYDF